jgi:hypothetical protein
VGELGGAEGGVNHNFMNMSVVVRVSSLVLTYEVGANCPKGAGVGGGS